VSVPISFLSGFRNRSVTVTTETGTSDHPSSWRVRTQKLEGMFPLLTLGVGGTGTLSVFSYSIGFCFIRYVLYVTGSLFSTHKCISNTHRVLSRQLWSTLVNAVSLTVDCPSDLVMCL
jgi:hypothetical protein